jgi:hypothetical protein
MIEENKKGKTMKKRVLTGLIIVSIAILGYLYLTKQEDIVIKKHVEVWKAKDLPPEKDEVIVKTKEKNVSTINQKPTVSVYAFSIATLGDPVTIHSRAEDKDGKVVSYLWQENNNVLGSKPELSVVLTTRGEHTITLKVKDNLGAMAKARITIDVLAQYDKKVFYQHSGCSCKGVSYYYYNDDGNVTKEIHESKSGIEIKEYFYTENGELGYMNYKQYQGKGTLVKESTSHYDKVGNKIEESGREKEYSSEENSKFKTFLMRYKWDKEGRKLKEYTQKEGVIQDIIRFNPHNDEEVGSIHEHYTNGLLVGRSSDIYHYSDDGKLLNERVQEYDVKSEITKILFERALTYNENGELTRKEIKRDGEIENSKEYRYSGGKLSQEIEHNSDATINSLIEYSYEATGLLTKKETIGADGEREGIELYTYNSDGKEISKRMDYDGDGSFEYAYKTFYDSTGNRTKLEFYKNGVLDGFTRYNSNGKKVENSSSHSNRRFVYDEETGILTKFVLEYSSGQKRVRFYDKNGDIIQELDENGKEYYSVDER